MKKFRLTILLLLITVSVSAAGNRITAGYEISKLTNINVVDIDDYLDNGSVVFNTSTITLNGANVDYGKSFSLNKSGYLLLELGAGLSYGFYGVKSGYVNGSEIDVFESKLKLFAIKAPINICYRVALTPKISLEPYAGLSIKINCVASSNYTHSDNSNPETDYDLSYNMLSDTETSASWGIGQISAQLGMGINLSRIYIGVAYNTDLTPYSEGISSNSLSVRAGLNF